jgi:arylsulfatase A-like enzyme
MNSILAGLLWVCSTSSPQVSPAPNAPPPLPAVAPAQESAKGESAKLPNLVLVTIDTCRADHLSCYGYPRKTSPAIDELANESILFERCYSAFPQTTPSHCSIFTGVYPYEHGVLSCSFRASEEEQVAHALASTDQLKTITEILAAHGYATGAFVSGATVKKITGLGLGFQAWSEPETEVRPGTETLADAREWLKTAPEPFFLWFHTFDAHAPPREQNRHYTKEFAADEVVAKRMAQLHIRKTTRGKHNGGGPVSCADQIAQYDAGLRLADDEVKGLKEALAGRGAWDRTTFIVTGDHGEGLGQHNYLAHALCWNEQVHVPFVLRVPGRAPERCSKVVSTIDVVATALDLTPGMPKQEFLAQARGKNVLSDDFEERPVFTMSPRSQNESSLTTPRWRFIRRPDGEDALFDLTNDPYELSDVKEHNPKIVSAFTQQLEALVKEQHLRRRYYARGVVAKKLSPEEEAAQADALKKLGYADGEGDEGSEGGDEGDEEGKTTPPPKKDEVKKDEPKKDETKRDETKQAEPKKPGGGQSEP